MSTKKQPAKSIDAQAQELYQDILNGSQKATPKYWQLGELVKKYRDEEHKTYDEAQAHFVEVLGVGCETYFKRACSVRKHYTTAADLKDKDTGKVKTVEEALGYGKTKSPAQKPEKQVGDVPTQRWEWLAANHLAESLGADRAVEVVGRVVNGEPCPELPKKPKKAVPPELVVAKGFIAPDRRPEWARDAAKFWGDYRKEIDPIVAAIQQRATTGEGKQSLKALSSDAYTVSRRYLTDNRSHAVADDPVAAIAAMDRLVQALMAPPAAEQSSDKTTTAEIERK